MLAYPFFNLIIFVMNINVSAGIAHIKCNSVLQKYMTNLKQWSIVLSIVYWAMQIKLWFCFTYLFNLNHHITV